MLKNQGIKKILISGGFFSVIQMSNFQLMHNIHTINGKKNCTLIFCISCVQKYTLALCHIETGIKFFVQK